ncbi:metallopeptidase family protein [Nocardioides mangrovi]|uniref:Metallopeptidase family protein n=1 Tax=Nocardioides mangrovi TaxID=2874580 RepID=A0ABS7UHG5_9ACTN|nr:metallopeptidase family protein [Nocardioides mangrovi]MBZ5740471.1 metallopeptidase family protein [Nocardioides mangrovi]
MDPAAVPLDAFEAMVVDALDSLPAWVQPVVAEIAVLVEDEQPAAERKPGTLLLGLYRGVPRTSHYGRAPGTLPDTITLYRVPIVEVCARAEDVPTKVRTVLVHEVGHAMGLGEARLRELGWA